MHVVVRRRTLALRRSARSAAARRLARGLVALLLAVAVLPSVLPYDHLLVPAVAAHDDGHDHEHDAPAHVEHCHTSPGSCADAPMTSGPGQLMQAGPLLAAPVLTTVLLLLTLPHLAGRSLAPEPRPPVRRLAAIG